MTNNDLKIQSKLLTTLRRLELFSHPMPYYDYGWGCKESIMTVSPDVYNYLARFADKPVKKEQKKRFMGPNSKR